jgi:hypothetical protein
MYMGHIIELNRTKLAHISPLLVYCNCGVVRFTFCQQLKTVQIVKIHLGC